MDADQTLSILLDARLRLCAGLWPILRDTHAIEDIYQVTLLRAVKEAEKLRDDGHVIAWARVTARNLAIDHLRKHQKRMVMLDEQTLDLIDADLDAFGEENLAAQMDALKSCIEKLPERSRHLVDLRYHENLPGKSMADALGMSVDAVYQAIHRIHLSLKKCMERQLHHP